jgi:leukotriene-A4 hydrolase
MILPAWPLLAVLAPVQSAPAPKPASTAAPASETRDTHSFGNFHEVRPTHLALDLTLRFESKTILGVTTLDLAYPGAQPPAFLDLDTRELKVSKVTDTETGKALTFALDPPAPFLGQRLRITLPRPAPTRVRIEYETSPSASALQWLDPAQTTSKRLPFLFTQSQAIHARSWIPTMDSPGVRVTYDAVVRVPSGMRAVMSAAQLMEDRKKGVYRFRMGHPIPPYLIALAAGEIDFRAMSQRTGVYAEPAVADKAAWEFADTEKMVQVAERLYGPYRWGRYDLIVLPPSFPFGGMENPRLTFATPTIIAGDRSLMGLVAHELAHSWSGNLVTNATWNDFWLNEGFTSYIENRIVEEIYGREVAEMELLLAQRGLREVIADPQTKAEDTRLALDLAGRDPDEGMTDVAYQKGAGLLHMLEKRFGRARFDAFLRRYFTSNAFRSMTTTRFVALLKRDLFRGDAALWKSVGVDDWIHKPGIPASMVVPASPRYERAVAAAERFASAGALDGVGQGWVTTEWLGFVNALPKQMTREQMDALDTRFQFSKSGNSEIRFAWLLHAVRNTYEPAFASLEEFLTSMGRRKFLRPLYRALDENPKTKELARRIYAKARPTYHPIAVTSIDEVLK